jgi:hypothetical protein
MGAWLPARMGAVSRSLPDNHSPLPAHSPPTWLLRSLFSLSAQQVALLEQLVWTLAAAR